MAALTPGGGVRVERRGGVAQIKLDRAAVGNAIDLPLAEALRDAATTCHDDRSVRCVLLTGAGRFFCVGGDVSAFADQADRLPAYLREVTAALHTAITILARMNKPIVTAINGPAAGAGIGLGVLGDIALVAPEAHFTLAYTGIGLSPDAGATWLLPRLIGLRRTQELCLTNRRVGAEEAATIGLVTRVTAPGALEEEALALTETLARGATSAFGATRRLLLAQAGAGLAEQLGAERESIARQAETGDGEEGIDAFLAKRPPDFPGE